MGSQGIGNGTLHSVGAFIGVLCHTIARIVDHIDIVARTPTQCVSAPTTIECVIANVASESVGRSVADEDVIEGVARAVDGRSAS